MVETVAAVEARVAAVEAAAAQTSAPVMRKHGHASRKRGQSPEYNCWRGMIIRCEDRNSDAWQYYGGAGITVDPEWRRSFKAFLDSVGPRPRRGHWRLERHDKDGPFAPND